MKVVHWLLTGSAVLLLAGCGGGKTTSETATTSETTTAPSTTAETSTPATTPEPGGSMTATAPGGAAEGTVIKMGSDTGQLVFVPAKVTVKPGDKITWMMNKAGPHNAVFESNEADPAAAKAMAEPKLLNKPGATVVVTVPANAKPGNYSFNCVPHKSAGMVGVITVAP